jgi:DNA-binding PadR family transcriptional regulator
MKQVEKDSHGNIQMGPGTLYGSIKRMLKSGLIIEVKNPEDERRKFYKLTKKGQKNLSAELKRFEEIVNLAKNKKILGLNSLSLNI